MPVAALLQRPCCLGHRPVHPFIPSSIISRDQEIKITRIYDGPVFIRLLN